MRRSMDGEEIIAAYQRDGYRIRAPAAPQDLQRYRSTFVAGACLNPLLVAGDQLYIEDTDQVQHGDLTLVRWSDEVLASPGSLALQEAFRSRFGAHDITRGIKLAWEYQFADGGVSRYWACKDIVSMGKGATPIGRVVAVVRNGQYLADDIVQRTVPMAAMDQNASSQTLVVTDAGTTVSTLSASPTTFNYLPTTLNVFDGDTGIGIDLSGTISVAQTNSGTVVSNVTVQIYRDGAPLPSGGLFTDSSGTFYPDKRQFALIADDVPGAGNHTYSIHFSLAGSHGGVLTDINLIFQQTVFKLRQYKR